MKIFITIGKRKAFKVVAAFIAVNILAEALFPTAAMALTSGPAQEEYASFEPVETTQMVDPYTGDFTYNLPLLSVPGPNGGYPINLAYHSEVGVDQEASSVGLGWNVNVGSISRGLRGLPDDLKGENITQNVHLKTNKVYSLNIPTANYKEYYGFPTSADDIATSPLTLQVYHNNYRGIGTRAGLVPRALNHWLGKIGTGVGLVYDSNSGLGISLTESVGGNYEANSRITAGLGLEANINSRNGLESIGFTGKVGVKREKTTGTMGFSSSSLSFPASAYVPGVNLPTTTHIAPAEFRVSNDVTTFVPYTVKFPRNYNWSGSIQTTDLSQSTVKTPAYGYLYTSSASDEALKDFSRKDIGYSKKVPNLSPTNFTYDLYTITGQGTGGMFRPYSGKVQTLTDPKRINNTLMDHSDLEGGAVTGMGHLGFGFLSGSSTQTSGSWEYGQNDATSSLSFTPHLGWEDVYFQMYGEKTGVFLKENPLEDTTGYRGWGHDKAVRVKIDKTAQGFDREYIATSEFVTDNNGVTTTVYNAATDPHNHLHRYRRRSNNIEWLTQSQVNSYGMSSALSYLVDQNFNETPPPSPQVVPVNKSSVTASAAALSEISVTQPDGMKYTYGLPAMNNEQNDASFRIRYGSTHCTPVTSQASLPQHNVSLVKGWDNSGTSIKAEEGDNNLELDGYLSEVSTPAYAHSWMLTSVVSNDYVDSDQTPGPSDGDLGYWVKFNYIRKIENYKWRVPYTDANYIMGSNWDEKDDMGTFSFGKKDIFYVQSIETKTHIAVFTLSQRKDGFESKGEYNATESTPRGTRSLFKLDKIELFAKKDYQANPSTAVPVKTVHFNYDYSLCGDPTGTHVNPGNDGTTDMDGTDNLNADKGKLTLKKVWFTYNNSSRGELSPYKFTYAVTGNGNYQNPTYNFRNVDRWGNFTPNTEAFSLYPYINFPYTQQEESSPGAPKADEYAQAWLLKKIDLPSGGTLNIQYEADDYAYVEDQHAMQMLDILDLGQPASNWTSYNSRREEESSTGSGAPVMASTEEHVFGDDDHFRVYFRLEKALDATLTTQEMKDYIKNKYLRDATRIYFNVETDLSNLGWTGGKLENVRGYAKLATTGSDLYGVVQDGSSGPYNIGYITLEEEHLREPNLGNKMIHPFRKAAFDYMRAHREDLVYNYGQFNNTILGLVQVIPDAISVFSGFNWLCYQAGYAENIALNGRSIIRLYSPDEKHGGGVRVKKIYVEETNFGTSTGTSQYGQVFDYTMIENGERISSGVAYEPQVGGDESALRQPVEYTESHFAKAKQDLFVEKPLLEHYYPGAGVGYRKVTISSLARANASANNMNKYTASPVTVYEFYSAKDFPVIPDETDMNADPRILKFMMIPGVYTNLRQSMARSQGYSIVLNDMAGKLKSLTTMIPADPSVTGSQDKILTREKYFYSTEQAYDPGTKNKLKNYVDVLLPEGKCAKATLGETSDIFLDMNENSDVSEEEGTNWNIAFNSSTVPYVIPLPLPIYNYMETSFKSVVTTKVIYRTGILQRVEKFDGQANIITENLSFDINTGNPVFTKVTNEFEDDIFSLDFPAYWYYKGMGNSAANHHLRITLSSNTVQADGKIDLSATSYLSDKYFTEGDMLLINGSTKAHIIEVLNGSGQNYIRCITQTGAYLTGTVSSIEVIQSGYKNLASVSAGNILTNVNPLTYTSCDLSQPEGVTVNIPGVIRSSAITFSDMWKTDCGKTSPSPCGTNPDNLINPYLNGVKGIWRPEKSYVYLDQRSQEDNIREDGVYTLQLFNWKVPSLSSTKWKVANTITKYSPYGFELENKDALDHYSSATYGYGNSLVTAVGANTKYNEMMFDGFEDYSLQNGCSDNHWSFPATPATGTISTDEAHTGLRSFKLTGTGTETVTVSMVDNTSTNPSYYSVSGVGLKLAANGCNGLFRPEPVSTSQSKEYVLSLWVKEKLGTNYSGISYANPRITITFKSGTTQVGSAVQFNPVTDNKIIEGWQRIYGSFTVPTGADKMEVMFQNTGSDAGGIVYFDDIRIHPFDANIKSFVYDPSSLKQVAELDANNYATFYVYDQEGLLSKTKKETSEGIKTITEGRSGTKQ